MIGPLSWCSGPIIVRAVVDTDFIFFSIWASATLFHNLVNEIPMDCGAVGEFGMEGGRQLIAILCGDDAAVDGC